MGRQFLIMRALTLSGSRALISGRDNATRRTSSHVTVLRLKGSLMGGRSTLISLGIPMLFSFARCKEASVAFLPTAAKKLVEFICCGCQIFWINLPFLHFKKKSVINYLPERTMIFLMQFYLFECVVSLSFKKGFLNQVVWFFKISPVNGILCLKKSFEAIPTFHEILDFLVDKKTGPATDLREFHGSMDVLNGL